MKRVLAQLFCIRKQPCFINKQQPILFLQIGALIFCFFLLNACATDPPARPHSSIPDEEKRWVQSILDYRQTTTDHKHHVEKILVTSEEMRSEVIERFGHMPGQLATKSIALWLLDTEGRNLRYDINANLTPIEAYQQRRGNCVSFTMLMALLAREVGVELKFNAVDIPNIWGMKAELGMIYYRHINAVLDYGSRRQVIDLTMPLYDPGYPQKFISEQEVLAMFMNNYAMAHLEQKNYQLASHFIKLGISFAPKNPDLWVNLGVINKRSQRFKQAEFAFRRAYELDRFHSAAVSNLERFYREQSRHAMAAVFAKQAKRVRQSNPYLHFLKAKRLYEDGQSSEAERSINRAIRLHKHDPRFYELKSRIAMQEGNYKKAVKALMIARDKSFESQDRDRYKREAEQLAQNEIRTTNTGKGELN